MGIFLAGSTEHVDMDSNMYMLLSICVCPPFRCAQPPAWTVGERAPKMLGSVFFVWFIFCCLRWYATEYLHSIMNTIKQFPEMDTMVRKTFPIWIKNIFPCLPLAPPTRENAEVLPPGKSTFPTIVLHTTAHVGKLHIFVGYECTTYYIISMLGLRRCLPCNVARLAWGDACPATSHAWPEATPAL